MRVIEAFASLRKPWYTNPSSARFLRNPNRGDPRALAGFVRRALHEAARDVPVWCLDTLDALVDGTLAHERMVSASPSVSTPAVLCGIAIGLPLAMASTRLLRSLLFAVTPTDSPTLIGISATIIAVGAIAGYLPARRAASVDPVVALRAE